MILWVDFRSIDNSLKKKISNYPKKKNRGKIKFGHACRNGGVFRDYIGGRS